MRVNFEFDVRRVIVPAACGLLGVFALHVAYPSLYGFWPSDSSQLAAWIQAFGAVAAIGAGFAVVNRQHDIQARHQIKVEAEKARLEAVRSAWMLSQGFRSSLLILTYCRDELAAKPPTKWQLIADLIIELRENLDFRSDARVQDIHLAGQAEIMRFVMLTNYNMVMNYGVNGPRFNPEFIKHIDKHLADQEEKAKVFAQIATDRFCKFATIEELDVFIENSREHMNAMPVK